MIETTYTSKRAGLFTGWPKK